MTTTNTKIERLEPCSCCGETPYVHRYTTGTPRYEVRCRSAPSRYFEFDDSVFWYSDEAIAYWNTYGHKQKHNITRWRGIPTAVYETEKYRVDILLHTVSKKLPELVTYQIPAEMRYSTSVLLNQIVHLVGNTETERKSAEWLWTETLDAYCVVLLGLARKKKLPLKPQPAEQTPRSAA